MKFRNPETGEIEKDINAVGEKYCNIKQINTLCKDCELERLAKSRGFNSCVDFQNAYPHEAAALMGYEVVEEPLHTGYPGPKGPPGLCPFCGKSDGISWDPETDVSKCSYCGWDNVHGNPDNLSQTLINNDKTLIKTVPGHEPLTAEQQKDMAEFIDSKLAEKEESNMDKPRIAQVLGVEVGEKFTISDTDYWVEKNGAIFSDGNQRDLVGVSLICDAINHPDRISRKPRFTEQEVEDAKTLLRILPEQLDSISRVNDGTVTLAAKGAWRWYLNSNAFPSLKPGEAITIKEICGETD